MRTAKEIAKDNDTFRTTLIPSPRHKFVVTRGVSSIEERNPDTFRNLITALREFKIFTEDNDPRGEHDFGKIEVNGYECFWKIDYFDRKFEYGADPYEEVTALVLTLMLTEEY